MTAAEVTLKSSSVPLFQRGNFRRRILTPLLKKGGEGEISGRSEARVIWHFRPDTCRPLKKISEARRAKVDEGRRTLLVR
jgi:hypothetical protein